MIFPATRNSRYSGIQDSSRCLALVNPRAGSLAMREQFGHIGRGDPAAWCDVPGSCCAAWLRRLAIGMGLNARFEVAPPKELLGDYIADAEAQGIDTIVAVGGDGTVRTIAQHLVRSTMRLGIIPLGTANNVAHSLGIPLHTEGAVRLLATGHSRYMDVGKIGAEYFLEAAGVGLFADALSALGTDEVRRYQIRRLMSVLWPLCWNPRARHLQLTLDGETMNEDAIMVSVSNGAYMGDGMQVAPGAGLSDGLFDVVIIGALSRWELLQVGASMLRGNHLTLPKVRRVRAKSVEIRRLQRVRHPLPVHVDDHICGYLPARMEMVPDGLRVIGPAGVE